MKDFAVQLDKASAEYHKDPVLEGVHLRKVFPIGTLKFSTTQRAVHAVEDASLALYPGRALALVGESGSGNTTVARNWQDSIAQHQVWFVFVENQQS